MGKTNGGRTTAQLREQFDIERELASRLLAAPREARKRLYTEVYDELFSRVPHHPQLTAKHDPELSARRAEGLWRLVRPCVGKDSVFLEIGAGDCSLSRLAAEHCAKVYAVDASADISRLAGSVPGNMEIMVADAAELPLAEGSVDFAFSHQLVEHLHPDDAAAHLRSVWRALRPGGRYLCVTSNRLIGPHDVSRFFSDRAEGLHLCEYSARELAAKLRDAGFLVEADICLTKPVRISLPPRACFFCEALLGLFPCKIRRVISKIRLLHHLAEVRLLSRKPA